MKYKLLVKNSEGIEITRHTGTKEECYSILKQNPQNGWCILQQATDQYGAWVNYDWGKLPKKSLVKFIRDNQEDLEAAYHNFPLKGFSDEQKLSAQFQQELEGNRELLESNQFVDWDIVARHYTPTDYVFIIEIQHQFESVGDLTETLQKGYDIFGMNGEFEVIDFDYTATPNQEILGVPKEWLKNL